MSIIKLLETKILEKIYLEYYKIYNYDKRKRKKEHGYNLCFCGR